MQRISSAATVEGNSKNGRKDVHHPLKGSELPKVMLPVNKAADIACPSGVGYWQEVLGTTNQPSKNMDPFLPELQMSRRDKYQYLLLGISQARVQTKKRGYVLFCIIPSRDASQSPPMAAPKLERLG